MEELWDGVRISDKFTVLGKRRVSAAILCLSSDIEAMRKVGVFLLD